MQKLKSAVHRYEGVCAAKTVKKPRGKGAAPVTAAKAHGPATAARARGKTKGAVKAHPLDEPTPPAAPKPPELPSGRKSSVTREDVIERLWQLATLPASETKDNINGQVRAASALAEIMGMKLTRPAGLSREFEGRSSEEQEFFAVHGYWPEQPVGAAEPGAAGVAAAGAAARQPH